MEPRSLSAALCEEKNKKLKQNTSKMNIELFSQAIKEFKTLLGSENLVTTEDRLRLASSNTQGIDRNIIAILYPSSIVEVKELTVIANKYSIPLYPISKGKNIGYGDKLPADDGQVILDMSRMNKISDYDPIHGTATIEPGVTQKQLYDFLQTNKSSWWMDATGAGLESSIVGNALEGGFGHTPKGNHRASLTDITIVLGNGEIFKTGTFPGLGPDLSGIFVQSNFGIIVSMRVEFFPAPEKYESFAIKAFNKNDLGILTENISKLRHLGTLTSLVHIANATRSLVSTGKCPEEFYHRVLQNEDAVKIMSSPLIKFGYWTAIGGIYGSAREIEAKKATIRKVLNNAFDIMYFSDWKIKALRSLSAAKWLKDRSFFARIKSSIKAIGYIHQLGKGIPSDEALENIKWKVDNYENMGLIWCSPVVPATNDKVSAFYATVESIFSKFPFEFPLTLTLVKPDILVGVISISFDKRKAAEVELAHNLYFEIKDKLESQGISTYRSGVLGMEKIKYEQSKSAVLKKIKNELDPNGIIAPRRYGII